MIFVLPGMGADHRMYGAPAWQRLKGARFLDWPDYRGEDSIPALADRVIDVAEIPDGATVVGSSLGGIVACEIARKRRLESLVLIGSPTAISEISGLLQLMRPCIPLAPVGFIQAAAGKIPGELTEMFSRGDPAFIRASCRAIFEWDGLDETIIAPVRIHGKYDRVVPLPRRVDLEIDGGHLIAMTHPEECVSFLEAGLAKESM